MPKTTVEDIMLPLQEYAVVNKEATLADALSTLDEAQKRLAPGRHPHRAILVKNAAGDITGRLGHRAFLRALLPEHQAWGAEEILTRAGVSSDMRAMSEGIWEFLADDMLNVRQKARHVKVKDVCSPTAETIAHDMSLTEAIRVFTHDGVLSLLVTRYGSPVGVLRLADVFDEIAKEVRGPVGTGEEE